MISKFWLIVGVPGVGKTTLCELIADKLDKGVVHVRAGEEKRKLLDQAANLGAKDIHVRHYIAANRKLSQLEQSDSLAINTLFFRNLYINQIKSGKAILVDTHSSYVSPSNNEVFMYLTPPTAKIDGVILLHNEPEVILERRVKRGRGRDSIDLEQIKRELIAEEQEAEKIATTWQIPYFRLTTNKPPDYLVTTVTLCLCSVQTSLPR